MPGSCEARRAFRHAGVGYIGRPCLACSVVCAKKGFRGESRRITGIRKLDLGSFEARRPCIFLTFSAGALRVVDGAERKAVTL